MPDKAAGQRRGSREFVRVGDQYVELSPSGVLKIGVVSISFRPPRPGGVIGFEAYCCRNDFSDCVLRGDNENCANNADRPITVWKEAAV